MFRPETAREIMVRKLVTLEPERQVFGAILKLLESNVTGAPVVRDDRRYLGIFSERCSMNFLTGSARLADVAGHGRTRPKAGGVMSKQLLTLPSGMDAFDAISLLLARRVSGAPVVDAAGRYLGVFSEKGSMSVLIGAAYDQLPTCPVDAFMDNDPRRVIDEERDIFELMSLFLETHFRRLPVLRDGIVLGQVSRRDVLRAAVGLAQNSPEALDPADRKGAGSVSDSCDVAGYMDATAKSIAPDTDLLRLAEIFRTTPYRRVAVVENGELLGLVSRRDLLHTVNQMMMQPHPRRERVLLYLSALDRHPAKVD